jgi:hypothetical protein
MATDRVHRAFRRPSYPKSLNFSPFVAAGTDITDALNMDHGIRIPGPCDINASSLRRRDRERHLHALFRHFVAPIFSLLDKKYLFSRVPLLVFQIL